MVPLLLAGSFMWAAAPAATEPLHMGAPLGVSWGPLYGLASRSPEIFVPQARAIGASFTRISLYWSQLEPAPGEWRWKELDAYLHQVRRADEAVLTLSSASPWATSTKSWVFPSSPAKQADEYAAFIKAVVEHSRGRIRYFQSDPEPNNPFFWKGSAKEFAAQQRRFYAAVKSADPHAVVVLGGCDGLFDPTQAHPVPGQQADMDFFSTVIAEAAGAYDVFDLRLYGDPYGIAARVEFVRDAMRRAGDVHPIISTESDGPGFFEFPVNRRWAGALTDPAKAPEAVGRIVASASSLPLETRMFLPDAAEQDRRRLWALAENDLVIRNVLALWSGVQRSAYFDLAHETSSPLTAGALQFGSFQLLERRDGVLGPRLPLGGSFARLAELLRDARDVERVDVPSAPDVYVFRVLRERRPTLWIAWRRASTPGAAVAPTTVSAPGWPRRARTADLDGSAHPMPAGDLTVGASPVFATAGR